MHAQNKRMAAIATPLRCQANLLVAGWHRRLADLGGVSHPLTMTLFPKPLFSNLAPALFQGIAERRILNFRISKLRNSNSSNKPKFSSKISHTPDSGEGPRQRRSAPLLMTTTFSWHSLIQNKTPLVRA